jgi:predicted small secreted protein
MLRAISDFKQRVSHMSTTVKIGAAIMLLFTLASCANTIRGVGRDAANTVNATQDAGHSVNHAAKR